MLTKFEVDLFDELYNNYKIIKTYTDKIEDNLILIEAKIEKKNLGTYISFLKLHFYSHAINFFCKRAIGK